MALNCPRCSSPIPRKDADPVPAQSTCPSCGSLLEISGDPDNPSVRPVEEQPVRLDGLGRLRELIQADHPDSLKSRPTSVLALHVELARTALRMRLWLPGTLLTTGGLLLGLLFFYVGTQVDRVLGLALGSLAVSTVVWAVTLTALATAQTLRLRMASSTPASGRPRSAGASAAGFGRALRVLMEHGSPLMRSTTRWVGAGLLGCWTLGLAVLACSVVGLAGQIGRALMGAFLGIQVLLMAAAFLWIVAVCQALAIHPVLVPHRVRAGANLFKPVLKLLRNPPAGLHAELFYLSSGIVVVLLTGVAVLGAAYAIVLTLDAAVLEESLMRVLSASPLARFSKYGLAADPSLGLQAAGLMATVSLAAVLGLLLSVVASYWGTAAYALGARSPFREKIDGLLK